MAIASSGVTPTINRTCRRSAPVMVAVLVLLATAYLCLTFVPPVWNWTALAAKVEALADVLFFLED